MAADPRPEPVKLHVYDLSRGMAKMMSQQLIGTYIEGIWYVFARFHSHAALINVFLGQAHRNCCIRQRILLGRNSAARYSCSYSISLHPDAADAFSTDSVQGRTTYGVPTKIEVYVTFSYSGPPRQLPPCRHLIRVFALCSLGETFLPKEVFDDWVNEVSPGYNLDTYVHSAGHFSSFLF